MSAGKIITETRRRQCFPKNMIDVVKTDNRLERIFL